MGNSRRFQVKYTFASCAEDSSNEDVAIRFDWGDGDTSLWSQWVRPGDTVTTSHTWTAPGTFHVRAQAEARHSAASDWSDELAMSSYYEWMRTYGGTMEDEGYSVQQTQDGGYIVTGSYTPEGTQPSDVWLLKIDVDGATAWTRTFGGPFWDWGKSVQQTRDGGYMIAGVMCLDSVNCPDILLLKTDAAGNKDWDVTYGGSDYDEAFSVQQTADGGYVTTGYNMYKAGCGWLLKTDAHGDTVWTRTFGHGWTSGRWIRQTRDGGYVVAAYRDTTVEQAIWLIKTDPNGNTSWTRTFDGRWVYLACMSVEQTQDGGFIVAGTTCYYDGGPGDVLLVKTDSLGNEVWVKTFGGESDDWGNSVQLTRDGGYIVVGNTSSYGASKSDVWLIKTDANGDTVWTRTFGGSQNDYGYSVQQTQDGGYIVAGTTRSDGAGRADVFVMKTDPEGRVDQGGGE
ncbi:MAG: hypothetical protein NTX53_10780 [candidate division WOR-3 bacterium]|nr:hypothetical protein [candidate division WOR-3 bacterium]